jgi:predicted PurR-regulated permease PerM
LQFSSLVGAIALLVAIQILWRIRVILLLAFAAVVFATAINCLVKFLMKRGIRKRGASIVLSLVLLILILVGFIVLIVPPVIDQLQQSLYLLPLAISRIELWLMWLQEQAPDRLVGEIQKLENITRNVPNIVAQLLSNFYEIFSDSLGIIINILLVIVVTIMLLANPRSYMRLLLAFFPSFYRRRAAKIFKQCEIALVGWTKGILFNMSVITILSWLGLSVLKVQLPLANALLAGLLTFIPNLGPALSCVPPVILAMLDAPWKAVAVVILYFLIQQIESNVLTPLVMKQQVSLLPAITLLAQAAFAVFFGFIGLFLALPLTVVAQVWINEVLIRDILSNWGKKNWSEDSKAQRLSKPVKYQIQSSPAITTEIEVRN